jgi:hypothetical protein
MPVLTDVLYTTVLKPQNCGLISFLCFFSLFIVYASCPTFELLLDLSAPTTARSFWYVYCAFVLLQFCAWTLGFLT